MNIGWIKLHREIQEHWIFQDPIKFKYWVQILMKVNHKPKEINLGNKVFLVNIGQSACSLRTWAALLNCSVKTVNNFFDLLKKSDMIEVEIIGKGKQSSTLVTVSNYAIYQAIEETQCTTQGNTQGTTQGNTQSNTQSNTQGKREGNAKGVQYKNDKNDKNEKKEKKENIIEQFEIFWELYGKKVGREKTEKKFILLTEKERTEIFKVVEDYVRSTPDIQFRKNPLTWLNGKCWQDEIIINSNLNISNSNVELYKHPSEVTDYKKPDWSRIPRYPNQFENPEEHQAHHALWGDMMRKIWTYEYETTGSRTVTW